MNRSNGNAPPSISSMIAFTSAGLPAAPSPGSRLSAMGELSPACAALSRSRRERYSPGDD